jgi:hypothetical protein
LSSFFENINQAAIKRRKENLIILQNKNTKGTASLLVNQLEGQLEMLKGVLVPPSANGPPEPFIFNNIIYNETNT